MGVSPFYVTRGGAVVARKAHNLEVEGANPSPAIKEIPKSEEMHHFRGIRKNLV